MLAHGCCGEDNEDYYSGRDRDGDGQVDMDEFFTGMWERIVEGCADQHVVAHAIYQLVCMRAAIGSTMQIRYFGCWTKAKWDLSASMTSRMF